MPLSFLAEAVEDLRRRGLLRKPHRVEGSGPVARVDGRDALLLCSNNYLGLADSRDLVAAAADSLRASGLGAGASRLICGDTPVHRALEERLASFVRLPAALFLTSGYHANIGLLPAIAGAGDLILSDELNHASVVDGCRLSRADVHIYPHCDVSAIDRILTSRHRSRAFVVTETAFSMEGDLAPICALREACDRHGAALIVDEAHALGVLGPSGRGMCAAAGVIPDALVGTLGKAFGCSGAFIAGSDILRTLLVTRCRPFVFTTAPPPAIAAACLRAVDLVEQADGLRARLKENAQRLRTALQGLVPPGPTPILPLRLGSADRAVRASDALHERGFFVQAIRPPTVPEGTSRLRLTVMATHAPADLDRAGAAIRALAELHA